MFFLEVGRVFLVLNICSGATELREDIVHVFSVTVF